ncbi:MAG: carbohydrate ABC transporter permease [Firmicutes bacterium]|nr:carbohydrate ABC transporter permease [Bacillota bacterium]
MKQYSLTTKIIGYAGMVLVVLAIFLPIYWLVVSSISTRAELLSVPIHWVPEKPTFQQYVDILFSGSEAPRTARMFKSTLANSFIVSATVTLVGLLIGSLAGYSFGRLRFSGRKAGLMMIMATRMLPSISIVIPLYLIFGNLQLVDTKFTLIVLYLTFTLPFTIWLMASFFQSIPRELEEAARIDGCTRLGALYRVIFPLSLPGFVATGIFTFMMAWDEFFFALIFTSSYNAKTVPVAIAEFTGRHAIDYTAMTTGGVLAAIPPVILALIFQRFIIKGLTSGAVKG